MTEGLQSFKLLQHFLARSCGFTLHEDQAYLMEARLKPVAQALRFPSVNAYVRTAVQAGADDALVHPLIDAMTTHETSFFRDNSFWSALELTMLPRLVAQSRGREFKVWSAGCSTGQEAYSLLMLLEEKFPSAFERVRVTATDVSQRAVDQASRGHYSGFEVSRGLTSERLGRHFEREGRGHRVREKLKARALFQVHNLAASPAPGEKYDLVLLRNVLIYFAEPTRGEVLARVRATVGEGGLLGVGATELLPYPALRPGWYQG